MKLGQKAQILSSHLYSRGMCFDSANPNIVSLSGNNKEALQLMLGERSPRGVKYEINARFDDLQAPFVVLMTTLDNLVSSVREGRDLQIWHSNDVPGVPSCFCIGA